MPAFSEGSWMKLSASPRRDGNGPHFRGIVDEAFGLTTKGRKWQKRHFRGVSVKIDTDRKLEIVQTLLAAKKAEDVEVIDLRERTLIADYFVVCSGTSNTHIKAIADGLLSDGRDEGLKKDRVEGYAQGRWVLVDYGDIVVHIFAREEREFYDIESLWQATAVKLKAKEESQEAGNRE